MLIRTWEEKDNLQVAKLEEQCFSFPWDYEMVSDTQSSPSFYGVVAEENQEVIGYAGAVFCVDQADVALVAVSPLHRRKKIAESMLNELIGALFNKGVNNFFLEVRITNHGARALYEKLGFKIIGIRKNYYEDAEDAIVMSKVIFIDE